MMSQARTRLMVTHRDLDRSHPRPPMTLQWSVIFYLKQNLILFPLTDF